ncbi:MAG: MogA/MoaB family molybdenum cofactor biosynthesis protein [Acidobacteriota bacterium]|nr:MAG: MogA/MoaB family molybdenum cofactor biosynthesis protein [Acidobacteriota bacterium]
MLDSSSTHKSKASDVGPISIALVTVSDSRTRDTDVNGQYLAEQVAASGHKVVAYRIVPDEPDEIRSILEELAAPASQVILFNGGTGISKRDGTFEAISGRIEKVITGFGELFRMLSFEQVGSAAMLSRATAGIYRGTLVFATPGSPKAVQLAWERLILPELQHLVWDLNR